MRRKLLGVLLISCMSFGVLAQQAVLIEDVNADTLLGEEGPGGKNYWHGYSSYSFVAMPTEDPGADVLFGWSGLYVIGFRYKRRLTNWMSVGSSLNISALNYRLKQDSGKIMPNNVLHNKENIRLSSLNMEPYVRINFGKRGNSLGTFIDVGGYAEWVYGSRHFTRDKHDVANASGASTTESNHRGLVWVMPYNYGASLRLGRKKISLYGRYRISDMIDSKQANAANAIYPELPRLTVGVELALILPGR